MDDPPIRPPAAKSTRWRWWVAIVLAAVVVGAAWLWRQRPEPAPPPAPMAVAPAEALPASAAPVPAPPAPVASVPVAPPAAAAPPLTEPGVAGALAALLGQKAVLSLLQTDDFPRRFVATVDNLGRAHAPSRLWPVNPTPGRFVTTARDGRETIDADNGLRYAPFVQLVEAVDAGHAVELYARLYPLLQQAYLDLGFPGRQFNDRLLEVIDQLLATPPAKAAMPVMLTEVKGPIASTRPWVRYEFADPALQALTAGQKIMLRVGPVNQRRLKARLLAFRQALVGASRKR